MITFGDQAPDFEKSDSNGKVVRLSDYRGKRVVVLYFYPRDFTPGCTVEACGFRDQFRLHHGSRILSSKMEKLEIPHVYEEFDDDHSAIDYRMDRSLPFLARALAP